MKNASSTKAGPGRYPVHAEGKPRYPIARRGGNWKGAEYLTQPEIDRAKRASFGVEGRHERKVAYRTEIERIIEERR